MNFRMREVVDGISAARFTYLALALVIFCAAGALVFVLTRGEGYEGELAAQVEKLSQQKDSSKPGRIAATDLIAEFYQARDYKPVWQKERRREALRTIVGNAASHGLDPKDYHAELLGQEAKTDDDKARREILYTDALVRLAYHLRYGKVDPHRIYADWNYKRSLSDLNPVEALYTLTSTRDLNKAVEDFGPRMPEYKALRQALAQHLEMQKAGGWPQVAGGPPLKPRMKDPKRVPALRARLHASGDLNGKPSDYYGYDVPLQQAVERFQKRHGLEPDRIVDDEVIAELNVPIERRIEQLKVNLERIRWVAHALPKEYILVDVAGYAAAMVRDGHPVWTSRVVVGKPYRETPVFRSEMTQVVLNPSWTVPPTILKEDLLAKVDKDPNVFARKGLRIVDENGNQLDGYQEGARVTQPPGNDNALGRYKFDMPNKHAVYLHDTPAKDKFSEDQRAFSSGCIRLEKPRELAKILLGEQGWSEAKIDEAVAAGDTKTVALEKKIPVLILYFTAEPGENGVVFRHDVYERDGRLAMALREQFRLNAVKTTSPAKRA